MKKTFIFFLIFYCSKCYSQTYKVESEKGKKIEGVLFYSNNKNSTSNKNGVVDLSTYADDEIIDIFHIGYKRTQLQKKDIQNNLIILNSSNVLINEVVLHTSLNVEENKTQVIKLNQSEISETLSKNPAEVLEKSSGVIVQRSQNGGGSPNIRGFEANRILLVVDGVKLNNTIYRSGHLQNILSIDPYILENVSVLHGPSSVFYGSGALGGAIILNTLSIDKLENSTSSFTQQYESSSSSVASNFYSKYVINKSSFLSSISVKKFGNLRMGKLRMHGYEGWGLGDFATNKNEQLFGKYSQYDLVQKIQMPINYKSTLRLNTQFSTTSNINRFDKLNDELNGSPKYKFWYYDPKKRFLQSLSYNKETNNFFNDNYKISFNYQFIKESRHTQKYSDDFLRNRTERINIYETKLDLSKQLDKLELSYGFSNRYENLNSSAIKINESGETEFSSTRYPDNGSSDNTFSSYIHSELKIYKKIRWFNAFRHDFNKIQMNFSENNLFNIGSELKNSNTNYSASTNLYFKANENNFISLSIFNSFRNPNVDDLGKVFSKTDGIVVVPNLNLKPEKIVSSEFIWKFINAKTSIELVLFYSGLKDAIEKRAYSLDGQDSIYYDGEKMKCVANTNINSAKMKGFNFRFNQELIKNLTLKANAAYVQAITSDSIPMAHIPPLSLRGEVVLSLSKFSKLNIYTNYNDWKRSSDYDANGVDNLDEATADGTPSWRTTNVVYSRIFNNLKISLACENIFDIHYKTFASGISSSGRNFILNLQCNF